ncbi:hypothetical protein ScalyP_jg11069 [Parmales sp. scaly parma]|nr:hypothetical protein ScalyP_jg11069 [Parmales sp. scaly parma]
MFGEYGQSPSLFRTLLDMTDLRSPTSFSLSFFAQYGIYEMSEEVVKMAVIRDRVILGDVETVDFVVAPLQHEECESESESKSKKKKITIIDSFCFFNELDLLFLRLLESSSLVDIFILVESTFTHTGLKKELNWRDVGAKEDRFAPYLHKIKGFVYDNDDHTLDVNAREEIQRDFIKECVEGIDMDMDLYLSDGNHAIFITDVDEIINYDTVFAVREAMGEVSERAIEFPITFLLQWHFYSFEWIVGNGLEWGLIAKEGAVGVRLGDIQNTTPSKLRRHLRYTSTSPASHLFGSIFSSAGWHLASFGGPSAVKTKLISTCCESHTYDQQFFEDDDRMERLSNNGMPYYLLGKVSDAQEKHLLSLEIYDGLGVAPLGVALLSYDYWIGKLLNPQALNPEKSKEREKSRERENYMLEQDILWTMEKNSHASSMEWWNVKVGEEENLTTEERMKLMRGMKNYVVEGNCTMEDFDLFRLVGSELEPQVGELDLQAKWDLVQKMKTSCASFGVARVEIVHDETKFVKVLFDEVKYVIKVDRMDNVEEVGKYHCLHIGLGAEQCEEVVKLLKTKY